jgi:hypothetical protein
MKNKINNNNNNSNKNKINNNNNNNSNNVMPFLDGFYSKDFILEMFSMRYLNRFGFFLLFVSTGLTVCYSFCLFYFVMCGDFNFVPSYSIVETSFNMVFWYNWFVDYVYFWWWLSDVFNLPYSFCDLFALLFKVSYFIYGVCGQLIWL